MSYKEIYKAKQERIQPTLERKTRKKVKQPNLHTILEICFFFFIPPVEDCSISNTVFFSWCFPPCATLQNISGIISAYNIVVSHLATQSSSWPYPEQNEKEKLDEEGQ